ncbi:MAG: methyltransferase domain-containing protein [Pseudomonadota bacterium]
MAKIFRKIQQLDRWLGSFPGLCILDVEKKILPSLLASYYGNQIVLIGTPHQQPLIKSNTIPNRILLSPLFNKHTQDTIHNVESDLTELPIASGSVDLVLLPHILEYLDNPRQLFGEACRIVKPEGHIIICGFNPYSMWGLRKWYSKHDKIPWSGNFIKAGIVKKWLALADFKITRQTRILYRPPIFYEKIYHHLKFLEWLGPKCYAPLGGIYILIAQAKVIPLTPIKLSWKQKISDVRLPVIGIPRPTIRNHPL